MLNIAICDDEPSMVSELETRTKSFFAETDAAKFYDGSSLLQSCNDKTMNRLQKRLRRRP